jgi:hypothetical protein
MLSDLSETYQTYATKTIPPPLARPAFFPGPAPAEMDRFPGPLGPGNLSISAGPGPGEKTGRAGGGGILSAAQNRHWTFQARFE